MTDQDSKPFKYSIGARVAVESLSFLVIFYLTVYGRQVCPFMGSLYFFELATNLFIIMLAQTVIRWQLNRKYLKISKDSSPPHISYRLSLLTWAISGILAIVFHKIKYPGFPFSSMIKLLSGYWGMGGGLLSLLEYTIYENDFRKMHLTVSSNYREKISRRFLLSIALSAGIPVMALLLIEGNNIYLGNVSIKAGFEALFLGTFMVAVAIAVGWFYGKHLEQDIEKITEGINSISTGDYHKHLDTTRLDELGNVSNGINEMANGLALRERIKDAFGRFVSPEIAKEFISNYVECDKSHQMGGTRRKLTVLYCDIRNFTPLSETLAPEALANLLNSYFSVMVKAIRENGGMIDKFIGDAIMAVFGLTETEQNHALQAVKAAIQMQKELETFNKDLVKRGFAPIRNGIGIHTGIVVAGYIGCMDRLEFTVIGQTVNIAARLESIAKAPNPPIVFSESVMKMISDEFKVKSFGMQSLKGVTKDLEVFSIESLQ